MNAANIENDKGDEAAGGAAALDFIRQAVTDDLKAGNMHELMRVNEAKNIHGVARIMASAALARKESRFAPYHYRADYTETDDQNFCGLIIVGKGKDGAIDTRFQSLPYAA